MSLQPVILCGGLGLRLWPLSRKNLPKQFLKIFCNKSLFQMTLERVSKIKNTSVPIIVTSKLYEHIIKKEIKKFSFSVKILLEPETKNTTASIYLAAKHSNEDDTLLIMPSDHLIEDQENFLNTVNFASTKINSNWFVFGIKPSYASTNYGYIETASNAKILNNKQMRLCTVLRFIEKPKLELAKKLYDRENFFWNSGIFMCSRNVIIKSVREINRDISRTCDAVYKNLICDEEKSSITFNRNLFKKIPSLSIDYAVLEKITNIECIPSDFKWRDVGTFDTALPYIENKNDENLIQTGGNNSIYKKKNKIFTTIGIDDLIVIDTNDATLITKKNRSEELKNIIQIIKETNANFLDDSTYNISPWGTYEVLLETSFFKVKKLNIAKDMRISYQYHKHRSEHWLVVKGTATVKLNDKQFELNEGESIDIKKLDHHYVGNFCDGELIIIEVQIGDYFGEDDIIRIDDPYDR